MQRVLREIIFANFQMKMGSGDPPGAAHLGDHLTALDRLPVTHEIDLIMRVHRSNPAGVAHDHDIAVTAQLIAVDHLTFFDRMDRRAFGGADIDAVVKTCAALPKAGIDRAA